MTVTITSQPLTYHQHSPYSYFGDLLAVELGRSRPGAASRLRSHAAEQRAIRKEREAKAWRGIRSGEVEYRVEPNTNDGTGGYFAPPLWMNEFFATGVRATRVLGGLMPRFELPMGISSVNLPILTTGTKVRHTVDSQAVTDQDIADTSGYSVVSTLTGQADVSLQTLEQSPAGAHLDWALLKDLAEDYDRSLETNLLTGRGSAYEEITGVTNVTGATAITYTSVSPTGGAMWPFFGEMAAQLGDGRDLPPEVWLMRTARWSWLNVAEDTSGRPFGLSTPFFLGSTDDTPNPVGALISWPVFVSDAIPANLGAGSNQDEVICLRPTDLMLLEGQPQTNVFREVLSGNLSVRIQMHNRVAAITQRYPTGIYALTGSGMAVQANY